MSKINVECPLRARFHCGNPCAVEKGGTNLSKAKTNGDTRSSTQEDTRRLRAKAGDIGCPKPVISTIMRSVGA
jgi:hypothetical protein